MSSFFKLFQGIFVLARLFSRHALLCLFLCLVPSLAQAADSCKSLASQIRAASAAGATGAGAAPLLRQLAAIGRLQQQRRCAGKSLDGFFNACRDLSNRKAAVQMKLKQLDTRSPGLNQLRARYASLRCGRPDNGKSARPATSTSSAAKMFFCVRLRDGYYFPAPNSQFVGREYAASMLDRCKYICRTKDIDLYVLDDFTKESEDMVSNESGRQYKELPAAYHYRDEANFTPCDFRDYHLKVALIRASTATLASYKNVAMPVPLPRPDPPMVTAAGIDEVSTTSTSDGILEKEKIRVILPFAFDEARPPTAKLSLAEKLVDGVQDSASRP